MKKKIFIGRENELKRFRSTIGKLQAGPGKNQRYANMILVYGVGGMGKTFLLRKFAEILETEYRDLVRIYIDWDSYRTSGTTYSPEELLDTVYNEFNRHFPKEMKPYPWAKKDIQKEEERIARLLEQKRQSLESVADLAGEVVGDVTGNKYLEKLVNKGIVLMGKVLSALDEKYLKKKAGVSDENIRLYKEPFSAMAHRLLECIGAVTAKKNKRIVLMMDTCEKLIRVEEWFIKCFLVPLVKENPGVVLVYSGRYNPHSQRAVVIDGQTLEIRGMNDLMTNQLQCIDMQAFSRQDIEKYLKKSRYPGCPERIIGMVQEFSRGVPFAVGLLTDSLRRIGCHDEILKEFTGPEFETQLRQAVSNEVVIRQVTRRFLLYCFEGKERQVDRDRIFTIAVLDDTESHLLKTVWQVDKPSDILEELQAGYALFIAPGKLHDVVKEFLVDYLLKDKTLRGDIAEPATKLALPIYEEKYQMESMAAPGWQERLREDLWKQALLRLLNAMAWVAPHDAVEFFIRRGIELFLFSPSFIHDLEKLLDKFLAPGKGCRDKDQHKVKALVKAVDIFKWDTWSHEKKEELGQVMSFCREALGEWGLEPELRAVLYLVMGRTQYNQGNYEQALTTLLEQEVGEGVDKALIHKWADALDQVGQKFCFNEKYAFSFSEKALKAFEKVVRLNNKNSWYLYHLGVMVYSGGNPQQALPYCLESTALDPENKYAFNAIGNMYSDLKQYHQAMEMYRKAIAIDPKFAYPHNNLGVLYLNRRQYADSIPHLVKSLELEPQIWIYVNLGIAYYCMNEPGKSIEYFDHALSCPDNPMDHYHRLNRITAFLGKERVEDAVVLLEALPVKQLPSGFFKNFFTDWQLLATSLRPPRGLQEFIAKARKVLRFEG